MSASKSVWRVVLQPVVIALLALMGLEETHGKELDYHEVI